MWRSVYLAVVFIASLVCVGLGGGAGAEEPAGAAASAPATSAAAAGDLAVGGPALRVEAEEHDLGVHWVDETPSHTFVLQNVGGSPLKIMTISPNFGLEIQGEAPKEIAAGQSASLALKLAADQLGVGRYERSVSLVTNDPAQPYRNLTLRGECRHYVELMPRAVSFGRVSGAEPIERDITITNNTEQAMKVKIAEAPGSGPFKFDLVEMTPGREYKLFVGLLPPSKPGGVSASVTLETGIEKQRQLVVKVHAIVAEQIEVTPPVIRWPDPMRTISTSKPGPNPSPATEVSMVIQVANHEAKAVELRSAICDDARVKTEVRPIFVGRLYHVVVTLPADYQTPEQGAAVTLVWVEEGRAAIKVPIGTPRRPAISDRSLAANRPGATSGPAQANAAAQQKPPPRRKPALELIGKAAPGIGLMTEEGRAVANSDFQFAPATVLNFIAPNCGYSKKQIPRVETMRAAYENMGVRFINVSMKMRKDFTAAETKAVMDSLGSSLELAIDPGNKTGGAYKVTGFPCLFIVREDGMIDHVISGNKADLEGQMKAHLDAILSGTPLAPGDSSGAATSPPHPATPAGT